MSSLKYMLGLVILATIACSAFAINCYQCDSLQSPKCGENFEKDSNLEFDCNRNAATSILNRFTTVRNATGCMKQLLGATVGNQPHILRSCYFGDISQTQTGCVVDPANPFVKQLACDVCTGNLCNGSGSLAPVALAIVAFFGLARLFS